MKRLIIIMLAAFCTCVSAASATPVVSSIEPNHGPMYSHNIVTVAGSGFTGATKVAGATNYIVESDSKIIMETGIQTEGERSFQAQVQVGEATSPAVPADTYTFEPTAGPMPLWYHSGLVISEAHGERTLSWGNLTISPTSGTSVTCELVAIGSVATQRMEDDGEIVRAGSAEEKAIGTANCTSEECPETEDLEAKVTADRLPWHMGLIEQLGIIHAPMMSEYTISCWQRGAYTYEVSPAIRCTGTLSPSVENGGNGQYGQSKLVFGAESGNLECGTQAAQVKAQLKTMTISGVKPGELLTAH